MQPTTVERAARAVVAALLLSACGDITVPDYNNPSLEDVAANPTQAAVNTLATGLLIGARLDITDRVSYVPMLGVVGRESYSLDGADPRFVSELLVGPLTNSGAFGAGLWSFRYQNIRNSNLLLEAVGKVAGLTDAQKEGIRGFAKTMQAHDLLLVINARDVNGAPIDVAGDIRGAPAPLATKAQVFARIALLLDEGRTHLQAAGSSFSFPLSSGFAGLNTPPTFLRFNRALRARVAAYTGDYPTTLAALGGSFLDPSGDLNAGAFHVYNTTSGETANALTNPNIYAHPALVTDAQRRPNGEVDLRVQQKLTTTDPKTVSGLTSNLRFRQFQSPTAPVPIIRNEELLLLRSEARWFTGDRVGALAASNLFRARSGGLAPIATLASNDAFVTALLRERRYSLMFEGGHRWIDHRRFGRLAELQRDQPGHTVHAAFLVPEAECLARNLGSSCAAR